MNHRVRTASRRRPLMPVAMLFLTVILMPGNLVDSPRELGPGRAAALEGHAGVPASPLAREIETVFARRDRELGRLVRLLESAPDFSARLSLEREIGEVKRRAILDSFHVQRRNALERGDLEGVALLDDSIRQIEHRLINGATLPPWVQGVGEVEP